MKELVYNSGTRAYYFDLYEQDGIALAKTATLATGDVKVSKDGGTLANASSLPTEAPTNSGVWKWVPSATELQCKQVQLHVVDVTGDAWLDAVFFAETRGNVSAEFLFSGDENDVQQIGGVSVGQGFSDIVESASQWIVAGTPTPTTTTFYAEFDFGTEPTVDDLFIDREILFTSGSIKGATCQITGYSEDTSKGVFTVTELPAAPTGAPSFVIV